MKVGKWITDPERTFEICGCTKDQKVLYARYLLQGEVDLWWDTQRQLIVMELGTLGAVTWQQFKRELDDHFFPVIVKQQKAGEFTNLIQGNMIMEQHVTKFMELRMFAQNLISIEEMRAQNFQDGKQPRILAKVAYLQMLNFQRLVEVASIVEQEQRNLVALATGQK